MGEHEEQHVGGAVRAEVVGDRVDPLSARRQPVLDLLQERHPIGGAPAWIGPREGGAGRRAEGAEDVALAAPAVVDLLPGPARWRRLRPGRLAARVALRAEWPHLVEANDYAALGRRGVERLDPPLFAANSGSTRSPNQVSCRRQRKPSAS